MLLPFWVRPNSSPAVSIGTPRERKSEANRSARGLLRVRCGPGDLVIVAVAIPFAIGVVVLFHEAHGVAERETIMRRDEVDAGGGAAMARLKTSDEPASRVAKAPASQCRRARSGARRRGTCRSIRASWLGSSELIAAGADVPGFGDMDEPAEQRVLLDRGKQWRIRFEAAGRPAHDGRQIVAEAIDAGGVHPGPHRVHHKRHHRRAIQRQGVATAGVVDELPLGPRK